VFAGSKCIDREIRTGAIVLKQAKPANRHAIGVPAHRFDGVIAKRSIGLPFEDFEQRRCGSALPFSNLLFDKHEEVPS
jgi:hypothetical protein